MSGRGIPRGAGGRGFRPTGHRPRGMPPNPMGMPMRGPPPPVMCPVGPPPRGPPLPGIWRPPPGCGPPRGPPSNSMRPPPGCVGPPRRPPLPFFRERAPAPGSVPPSLPPHAGVRSGSLPEDCGQGRDYTHYTYQSANYNSPSDKYTQKTAYDRDRWTDDQYDAHNYEASGSNYGDKYRQYDTDYKKEHKSQAESDWSKDRRRQTSDYKSRSDWRETDSSRHRDGDNQTEWSRKPRKRDDEYDWPRDSGHQGNSYQTSRERHEKIDDKRPSAQSYRDTGSRYTPGDRDSDVGYSYKGRGDRDTSYKERHDMSRSSSRKRPTTDSRHEDYFEDRSRKRRRSVDRESSGSDRRSDWDRGDSRDGSYHDQGSSRSGRSEYRESRSSSRDTSRTRDSKVYSNHYTDVDRLRDRRDSPADRRRSEQSAPKSFSGRDHSASRERDFSRERNKPTEAKDSDDTSQDRRNYRKHRGSPNFPKEDYVAIPDIATFDGIPYIEDPVDGDQEPESLDSTMMEMDPDLPPPPKWTRCSPADLYFTRDKETNDLTSTDRMIDLEKKFEHHLVRRACRVRECCPSVDRPQRIPSSKLVHWHKDTDPACSDNRTDDSSDSSSSDEEDDNELDELNSKLIDELQRKRNHPERIHDELWYNEPMEMNDGPLCHCSEKAKKTGIRHNKYPGEEVITKCIKNSNNASKLYHYTITMSPPTNFLTKTPTVINYDNHEYIFEGFSLFSHYKIEKVPICKVIRFNIEYTIHWLEDDMPQNFSIQSLDLFSEFLFTEMLELYDLDWQSSPDQCARFHFMPRFARKLPDNGKELLSMNEVFNFLLRSSRSLVDKSDLKKCQLYSQRQWQTYVDQVRGMLVTYPGKRPSAIRIDQLDRQVEPGSTNTDNNQYPQIIHFGVRPAQLSYAGDPTYQRVWKEYMKLKHLVANKPKVTTKDKEDLKKKEDILQDIRIRGSMKREVTVELSSEGYTRTGIRSDVSQHALLLPVLITHLRFHKCLDVLERKIQYNFKDKYLLQLALTHPSYRTNYGTNPDHSRNSLSNCGMRQLEYGDRRVHYVHTRKRGINTLIHIMAKLGRREETASEINHYERLEFLGDAVVEFLSSIHLFFMFPNLAEGGLAMYRAAIVQNQHLTILARKLGLQNFMLYGHGPDLCQDYSLRHAMANCFEALMGALLIDSGIEVADRIFAYTLFGDQSDLHSVYTNLPAHPLQEDEPNGDRHWIVSSPPLQKMGRFEDSIGVKFTHIRLLARAFTMRNVGFNHLTFGHNQRMEFLGDTVLQFIASEYLYKHFPDHHEGHLSLLRSSLVNNRTQAVVCDDLGMAEYIINSDHRFVERNELKMKEKADLVEAFLGSLYIDKDLEFCKTFCKVCFFPRLKQFIMNQDWNDPKSQLQQCCLTLRELHDEDPDIPTYKVLQSTGPTNTRKYTVAVYFRGKRMAVGEGHSIQQAEMDAASNALQNKQSLFPHLLYQKAFLARKFKRYHKKGKGSSHGEGEGGPETSKSSTSKS